LRNATVEIPIQVRVEILFSHILDPVRNAFRTSASMKKSKKRAAHHMKLFLEEEAF
jgi:hypothetical protein